MDWTNQVVVVIGASRGLGEAVLKQVVRAGAKGVGVARGAGALEAVVRCLRDEDLPAWSIVADLGDPDAAAAIAGQVEALVGPIDVVINCASTLGPTPLPWVVDQLDGAVDAVFGVNVLGPVRLMQRVLGPMVLRGRGEVVHITSDAAVNHYPGWGAYGASKAALDHLTATIAAELDGTGVRLWSADPGEMDTKMHADALPDADPATLRRPADVAQQLLNRVGVVDNGARVVLPEVA